MDADLHSTLLLVTDATCTSIKLRCYIVTLIDLLGITQKPVG
jgi:hypothetical protein